MNKPQIGSTLESLFEETGELAAVRAGAQKKILAYDLEQAMKRKSISRTVLARRMGTSRAVIYRMLDVPEKGITIDTLTKASIALGLDLRMRLVPLNDNRPSKPARRRAA